MYSVWKSVTRETISPCAQFVTESAATGNWSPLAAQLGPATCSTMRPPSSSPSLWHYGVSSSVLLLCSHACFVADVHQLLCLYILMADLLWQILKRFVPWFYTSVLIPYILILAQKLFKKLIILAKALNLPFLFESSAVTGFEMRNYTLTKLFANLSPILKEPKAKSF